MAFPYTQTGQKISTVSQGVTVYGCFGMGGLNNPSATEANAQNTVKFGFTATNFRVFLAANTLSGNLDITVRRNTAAGNCTVRYLTTVTGEKEDLTNTDTFVSNDISAIEYKAAAGTGSSQPQTIQTVITPATTQGITYVSSRPGIRAFSTNNLVNPIQIGGGLEVALTETLTQQTFRVAGTIANYAVRCSANTRTASDVTCGIRKAGANGNSLVTFATGAEYIQDTTNTDTITSGDLINGHTTLGASGGTFSQTLQTFEFTATSGTAIQYLAGGQSAFPVSTTRYVALSGIPTQQATEANNQSKIYQPATFNLMRTFVGTNTLTATSTITFRKNSVNGNQTYTYTSAGVGFKEDTTNTDTVISGDKVNFQIATGGTGTSITVGTWGVNATYPAGGNSNFFFFH